MAPRLVLALFFFITACESPNPSATGPGSGDTTGSANGPGAGGDGTTNGTGTGTGTNPSAIGPTGGSVNLLRLGITGDTRPANCTQLGQVTQSYPTTVINAIADAYQTQGVDATLDLGDHMYVCNNDLADAQAQMDLYMAATKRYSGTWFMTMGNHECTGTPCLPGSNSANYKSYMAALAPIAALPYYRVDIQTSKGLVALVVVADNAWNATQATWLESTLAATDTQATYTLVARHHPVGDSSITTNAQSEQIIFAHKYALFLTGHSHEYRHSSAHGGRDVVIGIGGAPLSGSSAFHGYALLEQQATGELKVTVYDITSNSVIDTWSVGANM